ncbi:LysR family transcriptional regulator [Neptunomonas qingdaonensis]|uniref:DNA-binding transcriptional regulator, LysR family n=1 Tax=Neptunomonas qingdaonensis TaxID=1045558 RepID=A0A1I2RFX9_9GAMM|nr:LysR family transcriptional regulator [Neptunomonas qingdaonensis]SFG39478.1 DNA-binding transcriptional regulator, LysR family [Neptunomonas qingdaonensis]
MDPLLDLELLRTFVMVVRTGELKKAAEAIYRSHAAVSMQMKRLEEQLGSRLMERSNRGITLTEAGKTLLSYSEQFLQLNNAALSALAARDLSGQLSFGIPTDYAQDFLNFFMPVLTQELPNLEARIVCDRSRNLRKKLDAGELDIAIVAGEAESTDEMLLWSERLIWSAPAFVRLEEHAEIPVAIHQDNCIVRDLCLEGLKKANISYRQVFASPVLENVATAVHAGFAISLLPESLLIPHKTRMLPANIINSNLVLKMNMIYSASIDEQVLKRISECLLIASDTQKKAHLMVSPVSQPGYPG